MMKDEPLFDQACADYDNGNLVGAARKFMKAAASGDVHAMARLAVMYTYGEGVDLDLDESIKWDMKAIEAGSVTSLGNLAITYRMRGNIPEAKKWFEKAIAAGDGDAALDLAKMYMVSDRETAKVRELFNIVIHHADVCEASREEAERILADGNF